MDLFVDFAQYEIVIIVESAWQLLVDRTLATITQDD